MANEFWMSDGEWAVVEPLIPMNRRGVKPRRNRKVISGIMHVLKVGCRWRDCPEMYCPHTTIYNRFNQMVEGRHLGKDAASTGGTGIERSAEHRQHHLQGTSLRRRGKRGAQEQEIGRSRGGRTTKIHAVANASGNLIAFDLSAGQIGDVRSAPGLIETLPKAAQVLADTAYDSDKFREFLIARGSTPVIKPNPTRKNIPPFDKVSYKGRNLIERAFSHLKDWRRVATQYDKLTRNFRATVTLALLFRWWI